MAGAQSTSCAPMGTSGKKIYFSISIFYIFYIIINNIFYIIPNNIFYIFIYILKDVLIQCSAQRFFINSFF